MSDNTVDEPAGVCPVLRVHPAVRAALTLALSQFPRGRRGDGLSVSELSTWVWRFVTLVEKLPVVPVTLRHACEKVICLGVAIAEFERSDEVRADTLIVLLDAVSSLSTAVLDAHTLTTL